MKVSEVKVGMRVWLDRYKQGIVTKVETIIRTRIHVRWRNVCGCGRCFMGESYEDGSYAAHELRKTRPTK